ncbi:MAG: DUF4394 domain-containing protein [Chthoniobacterales bacterium]|nr:DUF4394 domain-containing protein [Chthoniobacterales bacterium]
MKKHLLLSAVVATAFAAISQVKAELLIGLTVQNTLISFDSSTPGTISSSVPIFGVVAGETIFGIDRRPVAGPNNGVLYGFGVNTTTGQGRIYTLDAGTGIAVPVALLFADPADTIPPFPFTTVSGTAFGVDFNPVVDRLRVVSNTGQNLRINVGNGLVQLDVPLAYEAGDINFGDLPNVTSVAYSNNFAGAASTVLRGVDSGQSPDSLDVITNPNGGTLMTSLNLPFNGNDLSGYDISGLTGTPYFSVNSGAGGPSQLFAAGPGGITLTGFIGGSVALRGLAAPVGAPLTVPEAGGTLASLLIGVLGLGFLGRPMRSFRVGRG